MWPLMMGTHCIQTAWATSLSVETIPPPPRCSLEMSVAHLVPELVSHPPFLLHLEHHLL